MLKDLVKVANRLDSLGLTKEADILDSFVRKTAGATRTMAPTIDTGLIREVLSEKANNKLREANKAKSGHSSKSNFNIANELRIVESLNSFLDSAGDKVYITTNNGFLYSLWLEDPLDPRSKADPRNPGSMEASLSAKELSEAIGEDYFNMIKDPAREAGYIEAKINQSGYGEWQFSGDKSELDMMGYTSDVLK